MAVVTALALNLFPSGVLPDQLLREALAVLPLDVLPATFVIRGARPGEFREVTSIIGNMDVDLARALTAPELVAVLVVVANHVPQLGNRGGILVSQLFNGHFHGEQVFVMDEARQGGGMGVLCYWDGRDRTWRRVRDDQTVAVIP